MTRTALLLALLPAVALADTGSHLHPHGVEIPFGAILAGLAIAAIIAVGLMRRLR